MRGEPGEAVTHLVVLLSAGTAAIEEFSINRVAFPVLRSEATRTRNCKVAPLMRVLIAALLLFIQYAIQVVHRRFVARGCHCVAHLAGGSLSRWDVDVTMRSWDTCEWLSGARFNDIDIVAVAGSDNNSIRVQFISFISEQYRTMPVYVSVCVCVYFGCHFYIYS